MIKHADSHLDHGFTEAQVAHIFERFANRDAFFIETFELPEELGTVPCGLWGPVMHDDKVPNEGFNAEYIRRRTGKPGLPYEAGAVAFMRRGTRQYFSRCIDAPVRETSLVTVIAGPHDGNACVLYTAFGGPKAPKEPLDPTIKETEIAESWAFWCTHAHSLHA